MKQLFSLLICTTLFTAVHAQDATSGNNEPKKEHTSRTQNKGRLPVCYIGFSMGINNPAGILGFDVNIPLAPTVTLDGGAGTSTWGNKLYVGGKYYLRSPQRGLAFGGGLTFNSGVDNFKTELETMHYNRRNVTLSLKSQTNIFLGINYYWTLGRNNNRFYLEAGRSVPLGGIHYEQLNVNGDPISNNSRKVINVLAPGGFMAGFGFSFGLYNRHNRP